jgi:valyl-tRNA synthetase
MEIPKSYDPKVEEPKWQKFWEDQGVYKFDPESDKEIFSIDTPPPTVSGKMHMGHAFGNSQQDFIARFKRMRGFNVLQPFGTDDNGLPTQTLIQKTKKVRARDMERKDFVRLCIETLEKELRPEYLSDWKKLGISCDWDVSYTTIDPHCRRISQRSFIELYEMGRAHRKEAAAMWCPKCRTAIAQVELEDKEMESMFNDIVFKVDGEKIIVATTRPELLPACVAVFFHPEDDRYKHLEGKMAKVPLFDIEVPIMPDERADSEKGTGIVMCCTFGDQTDIEWQKVHNLPVKAAITREGTMSSLAGKYEGMKIKDARKQIIEDLKTEELLISQKPITHDVNTHERCGAEVEFVHSKQWFIKYLDLKDDMLKWGEELNWYPAHMKNRYDNWVKGLSWNWCISRQISFGIPFPVWYCQDCEEVIFAKVENLPVDPLEDKPSVDCCPNCQGKNFRGESDIINTWATSSLTPTIVKELFKGKPVYDKLINSPMSLRPQGHDIISFWLFNTVIKSQLHYKMKPWNDCFINGWMLDPKGKKMSKSKGNVIPPQGMIDKYSADALRYMAGGVRMGEDLPFPEKEMISGTKTINKIWNASKFVLMHLEDYKLDKPEKLEMMDKWILSRLNELVKECTESFKGYGYFKTKSGTDKFFWKLFCDNYMEIAKDRLYNPDTRGADARLSAQYTIYTVLNTVLKLFAPIIPHITESVYQLYFAEKENKKSIHISSWPEFNESLIDEHADKTGDVIVEIVAMVRKYKSTMQVSLKTPVLKMIISCDEDVRAKVEHALPDLKATTRAEEIIFEGETELESEILPVKIGLKLGEAPVKS